jgi:hypothetical protein
MGASFDTLQPGSVVKVEFTVSATNGAAVNADSLPAVTLDRNGVNDGAVSPVVTNLATGRYLATFTVPSGYAAGDQLAAIATYAVSSVNHTDIVLQSALTVPVDLDLAQLTGDTGSLVVGSVGEALAAARAQGFGKWVITGTALVLYASDGITQIRSFTLNSATAPTQRS